MSLADLRDGDRVFIDANIFIYHWLQIYKLRIWLVQQHSL